MHQDASAQTAPIDPSDGVALILGAGFSAASGVPLASQLLDRKPAVDRVTRQALVERVHARWRAWHSANSRTPEEYLAEIAVSDPPAFFEATRFVGLVITLHMGQLGRVGLQPTIIKHNLDRTAPAALEDFWNVLCRALTDFSVITTNFDILAERGLRHRPRPRIRRPGFNYGFGPEELAGGGYPAYSHIQKVKAVGNVPLLKLHGSVSWSMRDGALVKYHDCRPAIRGDAAIVAPIVEKAVPAYLLPVWTAAGKHLATASTWIVVGYSLPPYDGAVKSLLADAAQPTTAIHVFDPDPTVASRFRTLAGTVHAHPGLPDGLTHLNRLFS